MCLSPVEPPVPVLHAGKTIHAGSATERQVKLQNEQPQSKHHMVDKQSKYRLRASIPAQEFLDRVSPEHGRSCVFL